MSFFCIYDHVGNFVALTFDPYYGFNNKLTDQKYIGMFPSKMF